MKHRAGFRRYRKDDWVPIMDWVADPEIKNNFRFTQKSPSAADMQEFVMRQVDNNGDSFINFVMYDATDKDQKYIGSVGLRNIDHQDLNAELTIVIGNKLYRGKGLGQEALLYICTYAFKTLGLHKVYLTCVAHNEAAIRSYERFGFNHEGVRKEQIYQSGKFHDETLMGLLETNFTDRWTADENPV